MSGCYGRMGRELQNIIEGDPEFELVAGFDAEPGTYGKCPVFTGDNLTDAPDADVVIDFSNHVFVPTVLRFCAERKMPVVVATTALDEDVIGLMKEVSKTIPVFHSANMSLGVNIAAKMAGVAAPALEDGFDIEIVESHHNQKKDAPSGTAILLAGAINDSLKERKEYTYGRSGRDNARDLNEIGIHAVRGGTLPGKHTIIFAGPDEVIEITHTAYSRRVFASGAIKAAAWICSRESGLYNMNDLLAY